MYLPSSQIQENLNSNGDLVYKNTSTPYYGKYFLTSKGKYYANSPTDIVLIELEIPVEQVSTLDSNNPNDELSDDLRFNGLTNTLYSYIKNSPQKPPVVSPPPFYFYKPNSIQFKQGYSVRYFVKKLTNTNYIEIDSNTYQLFTKKDSSVATTLYEAKSLIWYLRSPSKKRVSEVNLSNVLDFENKNNWQNFHHYLKVSPDNIDYLYTKGNELLLPNRTSYVGYYHIMDSDETTSPIFMTGKFHGDGNDTKLIVLKEFTPKVGSPDASVLGSTLETTPTTSTEVASYSPPASSGGGGGGY